MQGLAPDIVPSTFEENLAPGSFDDIHEYPVATATHKAVEVYERLVVSSLHLSIFASTQSSCRSRTRTTRRTW